MTEIQTQPQIIEENSIFHTIQYLDAKTKTMIIFENYQINKNGEIKKIGQGRNSGKLMAFTIQTKSKRKSILLARKVDGKVERPRLYLSRILLSTFVENLDPELYTDGDHINRNPEDNSLINLRWATKNQNSRNRTKKINTSSYFHGVSFVRKNKSFRAQYTDIQGKKHHICQNKIAIECAKAYDAMLDSLGPDYSDKTIFLRNF